MLELSRAGSHAQWGRKYLKVDGNEYLFNIPGDDRERANLAKKESERLAAMRADWQAWNAAMPEVPESDGSSLREPS